MGRPTLPWLLVLLLSQALGDQGKAYRLMTELEHHLIKGTKRDTENPEVMGSRGPTTGWVGTLMYILIQAGE